MAGIGFEIKKILEKNTLLSMLEAYSFAGIIGSGPWILSILAMLLVSFISLAVMVSEQLLLSFLVSITYLMALSLILTGGLQLMLTRFVADVIYLDSPEQAVPNLLGAMFLTTLIAGGLGLALMSLFASNSLLVNLMLLSTFVVLCNLWLVVIFLSGMKQYRTVLGLMLLGYSTFVLLAYGLRYYELEGLLFAFLLSHSVLLFLFLAAIIRSFPFTQLWSFKFLSKSHAFYSLFLCGVLYNFGVWADKFVFWFTTSTSEAIAGPLRASLIYDIPIFLSYLTIVPGMAVFLVRIETDFALAHQRYYEGVRSGANFSEIIDAKSAMVAAVRRGVFDIFKVQGAVVLLLFVFGTQILESLGIDSTYLSLLNVFVVGVGIQVIFLSILNVNFYLDKRYSALFLVFVMAITNLVASLLTIKLGPQFYGYGFVMGMLVPSLFGLVMLNRAFENLEHETYMLRN